MIVDYNMYKDLRKHAKKIIRTCLKIKIYHAFFIHWNINLHADAVSPDASRLNFWSMGIKGLSL